MPEDETLELLEKWYAGDRQALEALLHANLDWMHGVVRRELTPELRQRFDSTDAVQDGVVRLLRYGPRFAPRSVEEFRGLLTKILVTAFRDAVDRHTAERRDVRRDDHFPSRESRLDALARSIHQPDVIAEKSELAEWIRLAMQFLDEDDRTVLVLRRFEERSFEDIARHMQLASPDAARMRFHRALPRLADRIRQLQQALGSPDS